MPFPKLPVVDALVGHFKRRSRTPLRGVRIVCVQHLLETTGTLLESFVSLGCEPKNIHVLGKVYSTSAAVEHRLKEASFDVIDWHGRIRPGRFPTAIRTNILRLWSRVEVCARPADRALIILDDGGRCRQFFPQSLRAGTVVAVEQTTSGLKWRRTGSWIPTVEVAGSAAKRILEPPAVTASIMRYVLPQFRGSSRHAIGVIGLGTVGADVASKLVGLGYRVNVHDKDSERRLVVNGTRWCGSLEKLFEASGFILGCTGEDLLVDANWLRDLRGDRVLASCSSEDTEFRSLLVASESSFAGVDHFDAMTIELPKGSLKILRGGFPANFIGTINSGPRSLIQVTRALLLAGVVQAASMAAGPSDQLPHRVMLDPDLQALVSQYFLTPRRAQLLPSAKGTLEPSWLAANSTGVRLPKHLLA